jgi:hypothetical protein
VRPFNQGLHASFLVVRYNLLLDLGVLGAHGAGLLEKHLMLPA